MAANATGSKIAHFTLAANTAAKIRLTGGYREQIDIVHNGDATQPVYFNVALSEAALVAITAVKQAETNVVTNAYRITVMTPRSTTAGPQDIWVQFYSAGTPTMTVDATQNVEFSST